MYEHHVHSHTTRHDSTRHGGPDVGYSPNTNFFDPDSFLTVSAMLFTSDAYIVEEVRKVLQRTADYMCGVGKDADPGYCGGGADLTEAGAEAGAEMTDGAAASATATATKDDGSAAMAAVAAVGAVAEAARDGQLAHHLINLDPTYLSIAGSTQLGEEI